jgi:hypothetical protein
MGRGVPVDHLDAFKSLAWILYLLANSAKLSVT